MYYNPIDLKSCEAKVAELNLDGFNAELSITEYEIKRETSKYNKYMKWHVTTPNSSQYYKSKAEAYRHLTQKERAFPIGDRLIVTHKIIKEI